MSSMTSLAPSLPASAATACAAHSSTATPAPGAAPPAGITEHDARVGELSLHYLQAGHGAPIVFLHGFAETSHMWRPALEALAHDHTVLAIDLPGAGGSSRPETGYDKKTMAREIRALVRLLGYHRIQLVGHDIGLMVAYAYAAQFPGEVDSLTLMDAFLPGVGAYQDMFLAPSLWHIHFHGPTPEALVAGRERIYLEHFWNDLAADPGRSLPEADRELYAREYAKPPGMRSAMAYFAALDQDAADFAGFARTPLTIPILALGGEKALGTFLAEQAELIGTHVTAVLILDAGHWLMEEARDRTLAELVTFLRGPRPAPGAV
jgi:pimeloyl-ACP methyl ester carboxylesterase